MARDLVLEVVEQVRGNALDAAARDLDVVASKTDHAAGSARDYSTDLKKLETQIDATKAKIRSLGAEFVSTHEKTVRSELRGERSLLGQLEKIRKELEDAGPGGLGLGSALGEAVGTRAGKGFVTSFMDGVQELPSMLRGTLIGAVIVGAISAAPMLGAVIAGAVVGTVGVGGLVGGIAAASRDPGVRSAASDFGKVVSGEFFGGGEAFVEPTIKSLAILQDAFTDLDLGSSWAKVAPYVTKVAEGIAGLGERFMPGFNRALEASGPALEVLAEQLPEIGGALSDMLIDVSESKGSLEGWMFLLKTIVSTIKFTGEALGWLGDRFYEQIRILDIWTGGLAKLVDIPVVSDLDKWLTEVANAENRAAMGTKTYGAAVSQLNLSYLDLIDTYNDYLGMQLNVDEANQRAAESLLRFRQSLKENGKDWRTTTEEGLANRGMLLSLVQAYMQMRDANIANGQATSKANAQFQAQLDMLRQLAAQGGATKQVLDDLVGDYNINVHINAELAKALQGKGASAKAARIGDLLGFAGGGDPPTNDMFWVGEQGAELMRLGPKPHVYSHQESQAMAAGGGTSMRQVAETLAQIVTMLQILEKRQPTVINVNATERQSPKELAAAVQREMNWTR